jgi:hypothetical protein
MAQGLVQMRNGICVSAAWSPSVSGHGHGLIGGSVATNASRGTVAKATPRLSHPPGRLRRALSPRRRDGPNEPCCTVVQRPRRCVRRRLCRLASRALLTTRSDPIRCVCRPIERCDFRISERVPAGCKRGCDVCNVGAPRFVYVGSLKVKCKGCARLTTKLTCRRDADSLNPGNALCPASQVLG